MREVRIVIFAKAPRPGEVKTRLIPALGPQGAAALARRLLHYTIEQALCAEIGSVELCRTPHDEAAWKSVEIPARVARSEQGAGSLGERLARASERVTGAGSTVLLIGTDCPALDAQALRRLAGCLGEVDAVITPAADGGYVAIALNQYHPRVFANIDWSTSTVTAQTLRRLAELGWTTRQLPTLHDIDEPADLKWLPSDWPEAGFSIETRPDSQADR